MLGQVLQGAQALPYDAQVPTLAQVITAFLEAWMDHILTRRIKFRYWGWGSTVGGKFQGSQWQVGGAKGPSGGPEGPIDSAAVGVLVMLLGV